MKIIRPITITDAMLTASNVAETDYAEFAMGTTYAPGTRVMDSTGVEILTLDVAPATDWKVGDLITGQTSTKTCRAVAKLTSLTYQVRERSGAFTLGEIIGVTGVGGKLADQGAAHPTITAATDKVHKIYESILYTGVEIMTLDVAPATAWIADRVITGQTSGKTCVVVSQLTALTYLVKDRDGAFTLGEIIGVTGIAAELADQGAAKPTFATATNTGRYPPTDLLLETPLWWKEVSATNRWKAFDNKVGSQTSQATSITYEITPAAVFDSIAFLNLDAASIQLVLTDPVDGEVYNETISLLTTVITGTTAVMDWYTYFFSSIVTIKDIIASGFPPYLNAVLSITITGAAAKVGGIVLGLQTTLGVTRYSPSIGIRDYSIKEADEYGVYSITERAFSKRLSCNLIIPNTSIDEVQNVLALYRANILVWVGVDGYSSMIVYGFYRDFEIVLSYPEYSECTLEIEGLT